MDILVFQLLRKVLPAHTRIDLKEFEPTPPLVQLDDPVLDAPNIRQTGLVYRLYRFTTVLRLLR